MATLKELHALMAKTGHCVHVTTISHALHKSGLYGRWQEGSHYSKTKKIHLESRLRYAKEAMWQKVVVSLRKARWNFLAKM